MIIAFIGKMGSGKTLSMTYYAYQYFMQGQKIYANYGLKFDHEKVNYEMIKNLDIEFQDSVICLDEIHVFIDSRASMSKRNKIVSYFITQSRKRNLIFMYTTQHIGQVDLRLRNNTDYFFSCSTTVHENKLYIKQQLSDPYGAVKNMTLKAEDVFQLYDTHEIVDPFEDG